jgi:hypothetical protein
MRLSTPLQLMKTHSTSKLRSRFYDPERSSSKANAIISIAFALLLGGAFWYSLTTTLEDQQKLHCQQGWQAACEALK